MPKPNPHVEAARHPAMTLPTPIPNLVFDHVGIVVADIDAACRTMAASLGLNGFTARFDDAGLGVSVRFGRDAGGMVYEFIAPLGEKSPVARVLASKNSLLNQIAYRTPSLVGSYAVLRAAGNPPLGPAKPAVAFGGGKVQFFWSPLGFVLELIEAPGHVHVFLPDLN